MISERTDKQVCERILEHMHTGQMINAMCIEEELKRERELRERRHRNDH